jgi:hypothetical protein
VYERHEAVHYSRHLLGVGDGFFYTRRERIAIATKPSSRGWLLT